MVQVQFIQLKCFTFYFQFFVQLESVFMFQFQFLFICLSFLVLVVIQYFYFEFKVQIVSLMVVMLAIKIKTQDFPCLALARPFLDKANPNTDRALACSQDKTHNHDHLHSSLQGHTLLHNILQFPIFIIFWALHGCHLRYYHYSVWSPFLSQHELLHLYLF